MDHNDYLFSVFPPSCARRPYSQTSNASVFTKGTHTTETNERVISPLNMIRLDSDSPKRMQALTRIAEVSHTFDALRKTSTFPAGYNVQNPVVHAQENALSELLTMLDAVEIYGFKTVREARKVLVGELEKVVQALGELRSKKAVVEDIQMEDRSSVARTDASEFPEARRPNHKS